MMNLIMRKNTKPDVVCIIFFRIHLILKRNNFNPNQPFLYEKITNINFLVSGSKYSLWSRENDYEQSFLSK